MDTMSTTRTNAPTLTAVPGTLCAPTIFRRLAAGLTGRMTIDPIDWLHSAGPWNIAAVADSIAAHIRADGGRPMLVIGHSTGGAIALQLAATSPSLVAGLLVVNSGAHMRGHGDVDATLKTIATAWGPALQAAVLDRSFATPPTDDDRAELLRYAATVSQEATLDVLRSQRDLDLTPLLPAISCPVTILHGIRDKVRTPDYARELAAAIPDSVLRFVDTGHSPVYEDADTVAAEVLALAVRAGVKPGP